MTETKSSPDHDIDTVMEPPTTLGGILRKLGPGLIIAGSIVGSAFIIFVPNIAEGISKGLSGAVFGVLLFLVIFLVPHGARQVAIVAQQLAAKLKKN